MTVLPLLVALVASDGVRLAALYERSPEPDAPVMILLPMLGGRSSDWEPFARLAGDAGVSTLRLDPRGHGDSANPYKAAPEGWTKARWEEADRDVAAAVAWLEARGVAPARIVVAGASLGGGLALRRAARDPRLAGAALVSAGDNPARVPASDFLAAYGERPVFVASAADDPDFDAIAARLAKSARGRVERLRLPRGGHGTRILAEPGQGLALSRALLAWTRRVAGRTP